MNAETSALEMDHTIYTDPSGFDPSTVPTAADQLRVFERAMRFPVFRQCLAFFTHVTVGGRGLTAVGVVMGQGQGSDTSGILAAAGQAPRSW